jgi:hypothetical protein
MIILVIMNCAGDEFIRYLRTNESLTDIGKIYKVTTYLPAPHWYLGVLSRADVIISQNVQSRREYSFDFITTNAKRAATVYRLAFWRFDGLWEDTERYCEAFFYKTKSKLHSTNAVKVHYEKSIDKFKEIEQDSDIKMIDKITIPTDAISMFSDNWHPNPSFFYWPCSIIMAELGFRPPEGVLPPYGINRNRIRLFDKQFLSELGITWHPTNHYWLTQIVTSNTYCSFFELQTSDCLFHCLTDTATLDLYWNDFLTSSELFITNHSMFKQRCTLSDSFHLNPLELAINLPTHVFGLFIIRITVDLTVALDSTQILRRIEVIGVSPLLKREKLQIIKTNYPCDNVLELNISTGRFSYNSFIVRLIDYEVCQDSGIVSTELLVPSLDYGAAA